MVKVYASTADAGEHLEEGKCCVCSHHYTAFCNDAEILFPSRAISYITLKDYCVQYIPDAQCHNACNRGPPFFA